MVAFVRPRPPRRTAPWIRRAGAVLAVVTIMGTAGCSGGGPAEVIPSAEVIPEACQAARTAFHDWSAADLAASEAMGNVIAQSIDLNVQVAQGVSEQVQLLIDELNADLQTATQRADESGQLMAAFDSLLSLCLPLTANLPEACEDEIGQYPEVTAAREQVVRAQTDMLNASMAMRDALIAGGEGAVDAAIDQVAATGDQLAASKDNWDNVVVPPFNAAVETCNAAIS